MEEQKNLGSLKAVFFDLDGTLVKMNVDWEGMRGALKSLFGKYGVADIEFKPLVEDIETALQEIPRKYQKEAGDSAWKIVERFEVRGAKDSSLLNGAKGIVEYLKSKGFYVAIISRNSKKAVEYALNKHGIGNVHVVLSREDTSFSKPHPQPIIYALQRLKIENGLMVGDHPFDIKSGRKAEVVTVGILTGSASKKVLEKEGADFIFNNLDEFKIFMGEEIAGVDE